MKITRILFICGKARMRSPTAADVFAKIEDIETEFAGLSNDADERLSSEQVEWADLICVMENRQRKRLKELFPDKCRGKRIVCLSVPDKFEYMQPELVELLEARMRGIIV